MSIVTQDSNAAAANSDDVNTQTNTENLETDNISTKDTVAYATYSRNLGKLKKTESLLAEAENAKQTLLEEKLKGEGKKDELITNLQERLVKAEGELKTKSATYAYSTISGQVATEAAKMGCQDTDLLLLAVGDELPNLEVDDSYKVQSAQVKTILEKIKNQKPFLFSKVAPNIQDGTPNNKPNTTPTSYTEELKKASTQAEFDALRKKYNRN